MLAYFSRLGPGFAVFVAAGLFAGMCVREFARAQVATRLGDPTPRLWGRLTLRPKPWFDPFGSGLIPGLIVFLLAVSAPYVPPFAYGKSAPINPQYLRRGSRGVVLVSIAGPAANLALALVPGFLLRAGVPDGPLGQFLLGVLIANASLAVFHLLPIPGLDGARMVSLLLHGRAKAFYGDLEAYLPLFALAFFLLLGVLGNTVWGVSLSLCRAIAGPAFC